MSADDSPANPFPGLRPFREDEEYLFFGRESQIDAMVDKLAAVHFLAVVGASGSGKSSLVNSGLRPALHAGSMARAGTTWRVAQFRPGGAPLRAMAETLAEEGVLFRDYQAAGMTLVDIIDTTLRLSKLGLIDIVEQAQLDQGVNLLVVVDQFEELFRYRRVRSGRVEEPRTTAEQATAFVNLLLEARAQRAEQIYVVITMRSDFLGDCAQFAGLVEAVNAGQYLVPRMTREQRRAAITGPIGVGGGEIAPTLLTRLVNDVGDNPDQLSILQHALNRTWAHWAVEGGAQGPLDLTHYEAVGGMAQALDQHAETAYAELESEREQSLCEKLFKALTDKATDPRGVRRPTRLDDICSMAGATVEEMVEIIDVFREPGRSFLMPPSSESLAGESIIDISHESLMRVWRRLDEWAGAEARSAQMYRRLSDTAALHATGRASLWRDPDLQLALDWCERNEPNDAWASRYDSGFARAMAFLTDSSAARDAERAESEARRRRELEAEREKAEIQARSARRMRRWAVFSALLAVIALIAMFQARESYKEALASNLAFISARLLVLGDFSKAIRVSEEAYSVHGHTISPSVAQTMTDSYAHVLLTKKGLYQQVLHHRLGVTHVAISPSGSRIATTSRDGTVRLWSPEGDLLEELAQGASVQHAAFFGDGSGLVSVGYEHSVKVWEPNGELASDLIGHRGHPQFGFKNVNQVAIAPDNASFVTASSDQTAVLWGRDGTRRRILEHREVGGWLSHVAFSADGSYFATSGRDSDRSVQIYDAEGLHVVGVRSDDCSEKNNWDCLVSGVAFSPTNPQLWLAGFPDRTVRLYDLQGTLHRTYRGHVGRVNSVSFHPDGERFVTASNDATAIVWDLEGRQKALLKGHSESITRAVFSPNGKFVATASDDGTAKLWEASGNLLTSFEGHEAPIASVNFSPDSQFLVTGSEDKTARIWRIKPIRIPVIRPNALVAAASMLPDGERILTAQTETDQMSVRLWGGPDETTRENRAYRMLRSFEGFGPDRFGNRRMFSMEVSPDGRRFVTTSTDYTVRLWDVESGDLLRHWFDRGGCTETNWCGPMNARFSPDGQHIITGDFGGNVKIFDRDGELVRRFRAHDTEVRGVDISSDSKYVATGSHDFNVKLWDFDSGELLGTFPGHLKPVCCVRFSPKGDRILSASHDGSLMLRDRSGVVIAEGSHPSAVSYVEFSPDGNTILSSSHDGTARVWNLELDLLRTLRAHKRQVNSARFGPDGEKIVTASHDGSAMVWLSPRLMFEWIAANSSHIYRLSCEDRRGLRLPMKQCD